MYIARYISVFLFLLPSLATADAASGTDNLLLPTFQFQHQTINLGNSSINGVVSDDEPLAGIRQVFDPANSMQGQVTQYDALITYPFARRNRMVNLDLGVNIRFIEAGIKGQDIESSTHRYNATLPMIHATAMFNLPYDGLSASLGGSHIDFEDYRASDYRAKLSYSWQNGFGLEGGWQHQQFSIDGSDYHTEFEVKGPFLDLKYRF